MAKLRPVSSEDRFTLVEHLTELRSRIIACIGIFVVAFAISYWQNERVISVVNKPLESAQTPSAKKCTTTGDSLEQSNCFDRAVADALGKIGPILKQGGNGENATQAERRAEALAAVRQVESLRPTNVNRKPVTLGVAEPFFQTLNVAMYGALVLSLPLLLYQLYAFLIPAFTNRERKAIVPLLVGVPFLFYAGVAFGYFLALPRAVDFLQNFNDDAFDILVQARDYYKFVGLFLAGTGLVFQVPVVVIAITRLGIVSPTQLRKQRGFVLIGAAVVAAIITPTPDAVTMLLMMAPLVVLFEASVLFASFLERRSPVRGPLADWKDLRNGGDDEDDEDDDDFGGPDPAPAPASGGNPADEFLPEYEGEDDDFEDDDEAAFASVFDDDEDDFTLDDQGAPDPEAPDPDLLGDPAGPRLATDGDPAPVHPGGAPSFDDGDEPTLVHPATGDDAGAGPAPFMPPMPGSRRGPSPAAEGQPQHDDAPQHPVTEPPAAPQPPSPAPQPPAAGWMAEADELDAADPFATDDDAGDGPDAPPAGGSSRE
ncbi:twin-arginine translocase subunit TatC [Patulibacter americanus]|uniref:twin-arginine translocase subunit TatC n=1 Tax=Patulibacter americanus TaxID=588672 RepID=UPI0003B3A738|nr:twin-arginine translocase subunit TatC [Patulibacter americanus]